jgi:probable HAF family extracellular repeat protein
VSLPRPLPYLFRRSLLEPQDVPRGINNHGLAVDGKIFFDTTKTPFAAIQPKNPPYVNFTFVGINDSNEATGTTLDGGKQRGFFYAADGTWTTLEYPSTSVVATFPTGINNLGQVVGYYLDNTGQHGFTYSRGTWTSFDFPNTLGTKPAGINDQGQIIGQNDSHAILYDHGTVTTLDYPGAL